MVDTRITYKGNTQAFVHSLCALEFVRILDGVSETSAYGWEIWTIKEPYWTTKLLVGLECEACHGD